MERGEREERESKSEVLCAHRVSYCGTLLLLCSCWREREERERREKGERGERGEREEREGRERRERRERGCLRFRMLGSALPSSTFQPLSLSPLSLSLSPPRSRPCHCCLFVCLRFVVLSELELQKDRVLAVEQFV